MIDSCYIGDVRDGLRAFIDGGIRAQTCVTSPPYWGLRDYGTAEWEGGEAGCDHSERATRGDAGRPATMVPRGIGGAMVPSGTSKPVPTSIQFRDVCGKCGARRIDRQIGLEPTIAEYVQTMVEVFRLVRDVLADDGTLWLNLGDSYATGAGAVGSRPGGGAQGDRWRGAMTSPNRMPQAGLKPKDLCGIPWRVAFALQADGWYLRSDIVWSKPNPMPESVTDRPTKSHEYLFLLSKRERYYYDAVAVAEPAMQDEFRPSFRGGAYVGGSTFDNSGGGGKSTDIGNIRIANATRNRRTVWTITTQPFSEAHFAVMPTALVEPCILAGSRVGDIVLDPFMGSGTVAQVAQDLGRRWLGCELNPEYVQMQSGRTAQLGMELAI